MTTKHLSPIDQLIVQFDGALRATTGTVGRTRRPSPADSVESDAAELTTNARRLSGRLMRVNHCGEVCAQALYQGQAVTARTPGVQESMKEAAREEEDHLAWCETRIEELDTHVSYLNPLWYTASLSIGVMTGLLGDRISLGFVAATEEGVCEHLDDHLERLPPEDLKSKRILEQMRADESRHATNAIAAGGTRFPRPVKRLMHRLSGMMTGTTYWI